MSSLLIRGAKITDVENSSFYFGDLVVRDGRFVAVQDDSAPDPRDSEVIEAYGKTVIPGLIDAHFHAYAAGFQGDHIDSSPLSFVALQGGRKLSAALHRGFTTVRDVAGGDHGLKRAVDLNVVAAPDYFFTGPALSQTGGHGDSRDPTADLCLHHNHMGEVVNGPDNLRVAVRERLRTGAHAIKMMASGGVSSIADPLRVSQYSLEEISAITDETSRFGSYATAHAYTSEAIIRSVTHGVTMIEHGNLLDEAAVEVMSAYDAVLIPTLVAYDAMGRRGSDIGMPHQARHDNQVVLEKGQSALAMAFDGGVRIGFGTDLMGDLDDDQLIGLKLQTEVLGFWDSLRSATSWNARALGLTDRGLLSPGKRADFVLLNGDLEAEPALLWNECARSAVFKRGTRIDDLGYRLASPP